MNNWQQAAQSYLARLGNAEYAERLHAHKKRGRLAKTYRHNPSEYHRALVELLGQNDEAGFKSLKMLQGYASDLGV